MNFLRNIIQHLKCKDSHDSENIQTALEHHNIIDSNSFYASTNETVNETNVKNKTNDSFDLKLNLALNSNEFEEDFNNNYRIDVGNHTENLYKVGSPNYHTHDESDKGTRNKTIYQIAKGTYHSGLVNENTTDRNKAIVTATYETFDEAGTSSMCLANQSTGYSKTIDTKHDNEMAYDKCVDNLVQDTHLTCEHNKTIPDENILNIATNKTIGVTINTSIDNKFSAMYKTDVNVSGKDDTANINACGENLPTPTFITRDENNNMMSSGKTSATDEDTAAVGNTFNANDESTKGTVDIEFHASCIKDHCSKSVKNLDRCLDDIELFANITDLTDTQNISQKSILDISLQEFSDNEENSNMLNQLMNPFAIIDSEINKIRNKMDKDNAYCEISPTTATSTNDDFEESIQMFILEHETRKTKAISQKNVQSDKNNGNSRQDKPLKSTPCTEAIETHGIDVISISSDDSMKLSQSLNDFETISISSEESRHYDATVDSNNVEILDDSQNSKQPSQNKNASSNDKTEINKNYTLREKSSKARNDYDDSDGYNSSDFEFITEEEASCSTHNKLQRQQTNSISEGYDERKRNMPRLNIFNNEREENMRHHVIPDGEDFLNLFSGLYMPPIPYMFENKTIRSSTMHVQYEGVGFDIRLLLDKQNVANSPRDEEADKLLREEAEANSKKILHMYPSENRKRRRRF